VVETVFRRSIESLGLAITITKTQLGGLLAAESTIEQITPNLVRITLRKSRADLGGFVGFVIFILGALYMLMPAFKVIPAVPIGGLALACVWAVISDNGREEYLLDKRNCSLTARYKWLFGKREIVVFAQDLSQVRLVTRGVDFERQVVELVAADKKIKASLPLWIATLKTRDQKEIGRLVAEYCDIPLQVQ